jgi:hypothetical protein
MQIFSLSINIYMKWKNFIQRIFTEPDGNPSNKRVIATYSVAIYSFILMASFLYSVPLNESIIHMADVFLGTAMGTYVVGRFAEKGIYTATEESKQPRTQDSEPEQEAEKTVDETNTNAEDESDSEAKSESTEDDKKQ